MIKAYYACEKDSDYSTIVFAENATHAKTIAQACDGTCHAMEMGGPLKPYCKAGCLTWLRQSAVEEVK